MTSVPVRSAVALVSTACLLFPALASASVTDLDISFCRESETIGKKLELTINSVPYSTDACVRYANLGREAVSMSIGFADGLSLADGRPGCTDPSSDTGYFAGIASYLRGGSSVDTDSFVLQPGESAERALRLDLAAMPTEPVIGCLVTGPASVSSGTGISVVVRRANIVRLVPAGWSGAVMTATWSHDTAATGTVSTGVVAPALSSVADSHSETVRETAPASVELFADARGRSMPLWLVGCLLVATFAAGLLVAPVRSLFGRETPRS